MSNQKKDILALLRKNARMSVQEIADRLRTQPATIEEQIK